MQDVSDEIVVTQARRSRLGRLGWLVGIAVVIAAVAGGWWIASFFQSADQREANAAAPPASPIVSTVELGRLETQKSFGGEIAASSQIAVTFTSPAEATLAVVTGRPLDAGASLNDGDVVTELNGRPVFAMASPFEFYRDLEVGSTGPDVAALQATLVRRGYNLNADGVFGSVTEKAVIALYQDGGYTAPTREAASPNVDPTPQAGDSTAQLTDVAYVPVSELLGLPTLPISVVRGIAVGTPVGKDGTPDVMLGSIDLVVSVSTEPSQIAEISDGDVATFFVDSTEYEGRVSSLVRSAPEAGGSGGAVSPSADGSSPTAASFIVTPTTPMVNVAPGTPVRVLIKRQIVSQESLLVPVIAITDRGETNKTVLVRRDDGSFSEVRITVLGVLEGQAAVIPDRDGALNVGDEVKVG